MIWPPLGVEEGEVNCNSERQIEFHKRCKEFLYNDSYVDLNINNNIEFDLVWGKTMAYNVNRNSLENHWMPFADNRGFKANPRLISQASGVYMDNHMGSKVLDGSSGLFCCPAGHCHPKIIEAVHEQMKVNTYTSPFGTSHQESFKLADRVSEITPEGLNHVFFVNSGSEAVDTALKITMAYHSAVGENRHRFVSRERAYHGVNMGGVSLSGMVNNRKTFPIVMPGVVMMRHTWTGEELCVKGQPLNGKELANDLQRFVQTYGGQTIAACIVEPVAGSTGTLVPPVGYLERLREICDDNGIILIFDEVITCLLYTSPSPRDRTRSRMPSSA